MQCVPTLIQESPLLPGRIPCHLLHPCLVWVPRDPGQTDAAALQMDKEQDVVGHQATPSEDLHREEVNPSQHGQMRLNEFLPRLVLAPLRCLARCHAASGRSLPAESHNAQYLKPQEPSRCTTPGIQM